MWNRIFLVKDRTCAITEKCTRAWQTEQKQANDAVILNASQTADKQFFIRTQTASLDAALPTVLSYLSRSVWTFLRCYWTSHPKTMFSSSPVHRCTVLGPGCSELIYSQSCISEAQRRWWVIRPGSQSAFPNSSLRCWMWFRSELKPRRLFLLLLSYWNRKRPSQKEELEAHESLFTGVGEKLLHVSKETKKSSPEEAVQNMMNW